MPTQYEERPDSTDQLCQAWRGAMAAAADSWRAINALGELLAEKAGIDLEQTQSPSIVSAETARLHVAPSGDGDRTFKIAAETQVSSPLGSSAV